MPIACGHQIREILRDGKILKQNVYVDVDRFVQAHYNIVLFRLFLQVQNDGENLTFEYIQIKPKSYVSIKFQLIKMELVHLCTGKLILVVHKRKLSEFTITLNVFIYFFLLPQQFIQKSSWSLAERAVEEEKSKQSNHYGYMVICNGCCW